jgi:hypothetical protein
MKVVEGTDTGGRIILNRILEKWKGTWWVGFN